MLGLVGQSAGIGHCGESSRRVDGVVGVFGQGCRSFALHESCACQFLAVLCVSPPVPVGTDRQLLPFSSESFTLLLFGLSDDLLVFL